MRHPPSMSYIYASITALLHDDHFQIWSHHGLTHMLIMYMFWQIPLWCTVPCNGKLMHVPGQSLIQCKLHVPVVHIFASYTTPSQYDEHGILRINFYNSHECPGHCVYECKFHVVLRAVALCLLRQICTFRNVSPSLSKGRFPGAKPPPAPTKGAGKQQEDNWRKWQRRENVINFWHREPVSLSPAGEKCNNGVAHANRPNNIINSFLFLSMDHYWLR